MTILHHNTYVLLALSPLLVPLFVVALFERSDLFVEAQLIITQIDQRLVRCNT